MNYGSIDILVGATILVLWAVGFFVGTHKLTVSLLGIFLGMGFFLVSEEIYLFSGSSMGFISMQVGLYSIALLGLLLPFRGGVQVSHNATGIVHRFVSSILISMLYVATLVSMSFLYITKSAPFQNIATDWFSEEQIFLFFGDSVLLSFFVNYAHVFIIISIYTILVQLIFQNMYSHISTWTYIGILSMKKSLLLKNHEQQTQDYDESGQYEVDEN